MPDQGDSVLSRKIGKTAVGRSPIAQINQIGETFAGLLDESLHAHLGCLTSSIILECEVKRLTQVLEELPVPAMIAIVDVEDCDSKALVNLENDLIFHVVDLMMGGDPDVSPSPVARGVTDIDAAICRGFIDILLGCLGRAVRIGLEAPKLPALAVSGFEQNVAMVRIAPENADVLILNLSLDIGEAARNGALDVVMPLAVLDHFLSDAKAAPPRPATAQSRDRWARRMARAAAESTVRLTSVACRRPLSVAELRALAPGDVLPLPDAALHEIELYLEGAGRAPVARGRLGALDGRKALKLSMAPDAAALERIAGMIARPPDAGP